MNADNKTKQPFHIDTIDYYAYRKLSTANFYLLDILTREPVKQARNSIKDMFRDCDKMCLAGPADAFQSPTSSPAGQFYAARLREICEEVMETWPEFTMKLGEFLFTTKGDFECGLLAYPN